ncbi:MAG TPA: ABC transporter permease [Acidimicrobiales bacterium]|nr:ABC transporter permease [Acidimicrobiales bacterium]
MRSADAGAPLDVSGEDAPPPSFTELAGVYALTVGAIAAAEIQRVRREPSVILTRAVQPLLWLLVFGAALSRVRGLATEGTDYQAFILPGVLAQSVLFVAIFSGLSILWERDLGITERILVAPVPRSAVIVGKALASGVRALVQVVLVLVVAAVAGIPLRWTVLGVVGALVTILLGAVLLSSVSMVIASGVRSREKFMGIGQLVSLPLFFASNALYAVTVMPAWLRWVANANPLTYEIEALRRFLVDVGPDRLAVDFAVILAGVVVAVAAATKLYPRVVV